LNVPDSILLKMPTKDLVKTCLTYPCWILITSRDNNQTGYDYLSLMDLGNWKNALMHLMNY